MPMPMLMPTWTVSRWKKMATEMMVMRTIRKLTQMLKMKERMPMRFSFELTEVYSYR